MWDMEENTNLPFENLRDRCHIIDPIDVKSSIDEISKLDAEFSQEQLVLLYNYFFEVSNSYEILIFLLGKIDKIKSPSSRPILIDSLLMKSKLEQRIPDIENITRIRVNITKALANTKDSQAVYPLLYCLNSKDENYKIKLSCAEALGKIGDKYAVLPLMNIIEDETESSVTLMTLHSAKGLEFPVVFLVGMEEGIFPGRQSIGEQKEMEEERRLCYVAMTRAMKKLYLSTSQGMVFSGGFQERGVASQFFKEAGLIVKQESKEKKTYEYGDYNPYKSNKKSSNYFSDDEYYVPKQNTKISEELNKKHVQNLNKSSQGTITIDWKVGDTVIHKTLGRGKVITILDDNIIQVEFDEHGKKTILGNHPSVSKGD